VIADTFDNSLLVSLSACAHLAAASSVHENDEVNAFNFYVNSESSSIDRSSTSGDISAVGSLNSDAVAKFISKSGSKYLLDNFVHDGGVISVSENVITVRPFAKAPSQESVEFDLTNKADASFFGELLAIDSLLNDLKTGSLAKFVEDGSPDSFVLTLSGFKGILAENGVSHRKTLVAAQILDSVVPQVISIFNKMYHSETTAQVLLLGSPSKLADVQVKKDILSAVEDNLHSNIKVESTYPTIYVEESLSHDDLQALCSRIHNSVSTHGLKAECVREFTRPVLLQQKSSLKQTTNTTTTTMETVINFQINLWVSFIFVLIVIAGIYPLIYMDATTGTFSSFLFAKKYI